MSLIHSSVIGSPGNRPANQGIKTAVLDGALDRVQPGNRPANQGIKTSSGPPYAGQYAPGNRPANQGIKTIGAKRSILSTRARKPPRQSGD